MIDLKLVIMNNWTTLRMLYFLSYLLASQFGEIMFTKISFDEVVAMSDTAGLLVITHLR